MNEHTKGLLLTAKFSKATIDSLAWRLKHAEKLNPALFSGATANVVGGKWRAEVQMSISKSKVDVRVWLVDNGTNEKIGDIYPEVAQA